MSSSTQQMLIFERPLPEVEASIWRILRRDHLGRENAIRMPALAAMLGVSTRSVQGAIEYLIREHGKPIGSSCGKVPGYYVITDQADFELTFRNRVHRGISNLAAAYALKKTPELAAALGQLSAIKTV